MQHWTAVGYYHMTIYWPMMPTSCAVPDTAFTIHHQCQMQPGESYIPLQWNIVLRYHHRVTSAWREWERRHY